MKINEKKSKISFIKKSETFYNNIKEVCCDSKSSFNKIMLFGAILFAIVIFYFIGKTIYFDHINGGLNWKFTNIISIFCILLLSISPTIFCTFRIVNFRFYIDDEKLTYKNILGKKYSYKITDIVQAKYLSSVGESTVDSIVIKLTDKKKIKISTTDRNFDLLKCFLISKNLLV